MESNRSILRRLAEDYLSVCAEPVQQERRGLWRAHEQAEMVSCGFDPESIRATLHHDLSICKSNGCHADTTLKNVETVERDPRRVRERVRIARQVVEELA